METGPFWLSIPAALLAALLVWAGNAGLALWFTGRCRVVLLGPALEESTKTLLALALGAWLPGVHLGFGLLEGVWEWRAGRGDRRALLAAVLTHGALGGLTWYVLGWTNSIWPAVLAAWLLHAAWNGLVWRLAPPAGPRAASPARPGAK
ncbi:MAG: hypothetical protein ACUVTU_07760 [Desulfurispora sp.]|uniref:hypothetical protein n=1 Tax=Desulfurispora sp. TaxID=3014275 RepID=UPI004048F66F